MRPQKVLDTEILAGLTKVFRAKGYEGASLKDLAEATGLKKASLYHRFPNGKQEMAEAVLNHVGDWVTNNVFRALKEEEVDPHLRLTNGLAQIMKLYSRGEEVCIFRALSMEAGLDLFDKQINAGMSEWIATFRHLGLSLGLDEAEAQEYAVQALIDIQGGLVVCKGLGDVKVFEKTLARIEARYMKR